MAFPIITENRQKAYEHACKTLQDMPNIPEICGYYGRACRQMDKKEGANRMLCSECSLKKFAEEADAFDTNYGLTTGKE